MDLDGISLVVLQERGVALYIVKTERQGMTKKNRFSKVFKSVNDLCDVITVIIHCPDDNTFLVAYDPTLDYHIPFIPATRNSWNSQVQAFIKEYIGIPTDGGGKLWRTIRFWRADDERYLLNVIFEAPITMILKKKCKLYKPPKVSKTKWLTMTEFEQLYKSGLHGMSPDVTTYIPLEYEVTSKLGMFYECAIVQNYNLIEVTKENVMNVSRSNVSEIIGSLTLTTPDLITLHDEYLKVTYPNIIMGSKAFSRFANIVGWNEYLYQTAYRGADLSGKGGINFREFLYLICAIDPESQFKGPSLESRSKFIFRCFDRNKDNRLNSSEFSELIQSVRSARAMHVLPTFSIENEIEQTMRAMDLRPNSEVPLQAFVKMAIIPKFQYFLTMLRAPETITTFTANMRERALLESSSTRSTDSLHLKQPRPEYILSSFVTKMHRGVVVETFDIDKLDGINIREMKNQLLRTPSADMFIKSASPQNEVLSSLKYFANVELTYFKEDDGNEDLKPPMRRVSKEEFCWGTFDFGQFVHFLLAVCSKVTKILQTEKRMLILRSPIYIIGDLHGNIQDLCCFEREIWPMGFTLLPCSVLFLGDYIDRGEFGIEVVAYLFAHKARSPQTVFLVRGNHEIRSTQKQQASYNTFFKECSRRCGNELGKQLWNAVNDTFDCMPLAACIDGKVFCCHGGIPPPWVCPTIGAIQYIPCPLPLPENNSIAWELLWNDPARESELSEKVKNEMASNEGFSHNVKRATAHIFDENALQKFLQINQLSFVVRGHESVKTGFQVHHNWRLLTVFSSSYYSGSNKAACILIQNNAKLKIIQITTDEFHAEKRILIDPKRV